MICFLKATGELGGCASMRRGWVPVGGCRMNGEIVNTSLLSTRDSESEDNQEEAVGSRWNQRQVRQQLYFFYNQDTGCMLFLVLEKRLKEEDHMVIRLGAVGGDRVECTR